MLRLSPACPEKKTDISRLLSSILPCVYLSRSTLHIFCKMITLRLFLCVTLLQIEKVSGNATVFVRGSTGVMAAWGFHYYLTQFCHCQVSWDTDQLNLPAVLPDVSVRITSLDKYRIIFFFQSLQYLRNYLNRLIKTIIQVTLLPEYLHCQLQFCVVPVASLGT